MQQGIENSTNRVRDASIDTRKFLESTSEQVDHVLITNYKQLSIQLDNIMRGNLRVCEISVSHFVKNDKFLYFLFMQKHRVSS